MATRKKIITEKDIRAAMLMGIGLANLGRKSAEKQINKFSKRYKLSNKEGDALAKNVLNQVDKTHKQLAKNLQVEFKKHARSALSASRDTLKTVDKTLALVQATFAKSAKPVKRKRKQ